MSIAPAVTQTTYALIGANLGPFATVWPYETSTNVTAWLDIGDTSTVLAQGTDFTVADLVPLSTGGAVTLNAGLIPGAAWPASASLVLIRATSTDQPSAFGQAVDFSPAAMEAALDHVDRQVQDLRAAQAQALTHAPGAASQYDAGGRKILGVAASTDAGSAVNLAELQAAIAQAGGAFAPQMVLDSYAALRLITAPPAQIMVLRGRTVVSDGGQGVFYYDAADTTSADDGATILVPAAVLTGRWKRIYTGPMDLRWFGARCNGVAIDTAAVRSAFAALDARGGGALLVPGMAVLDAPVTLTGNSYRIVGLENDTCGFKASGAFADLFVFAATAAKIKAENLIFDSTGTTTRLMSMVAGCTVLTFNGCRFVGDRNGDLVFSQASGFVRFDDCGASVNNANTNWLTLDGYNSNNRVERCGAGGPGTWIKITNTPNVRVEGLIIAECHAIVTGAFTLRIGGGAYMTTVADNILDQATGNGVVIAEGATLTNIHDNWIGLHVTSVGTGLLVEGAAGATAIDLHGNTFAGGNQAIYVAADATHRTNNVDILDNTFTGAAVYTILLDSVNDAKLSKNRDIGAPANGSWGTQASNALHGVYDIGDNNWSANLLTTIDAASAYQCRPDRGRTLAADGGAPGGVLSQSVAHGLAMAPDHILISPNGAAGTYEWANVTATHFDIASSIAPASWSWTAKVAR